MIGLKIKKPNNCMICPVRMDCKIYTKWLHNRDVIKPEKKMFTRECMLVDFEAYEDDLK